MNKLKILFLSCAIALFTCVAFTPTSSAQVSFGINIGVPPTCPYGYFDYAPYQCAPYGYYGPGYFYNGIFLGVGPWSNWGYGHGWGSHRFGGARGGHYVPGRRYTGPAYNAHGRPGGGVSHASHGGGHPVSHGAAPHGGGGHPVAHSSGGHPSGGGGHPGGGGAPHGGGGHPGGGGGHDNGHH